jgi:hypothetical protein
MATALFNYSLVARSQGRRGATKAELMAALLLPVNGSSSPFSAVEEVFTEIVGDEGLGALEVSRPSSNQPERYWLTIKQTLRMFFNSAKNQISEDDAFRVIWEKAQALQFKGQFSTVQFVPAPTGRQTLSEVAGGYDSEENRLLVLNPQHWTLLNGEDSRSREDIRRILGVGENALIVDNAASCVVAAVNTYQRRYAMQAARDLLTWELVAQQVIEGDERDEVSTEIVKARDLLAETVRKAYRHYAYLTRKGDQLEVVFTRFDDDKLTALNGNDVWSALVLANRAIGEYFDTAAKARKRKLLAEQYLAMLLGGFDRHLTLRDVISSFYKNPRFPLVPSLEDIRAAIFNLLQEPNLAGPGTGGWELVGSDGSPIEVANAKEIAISSAQQQVRRRQAKSEESQVEESGTRSGATTGGPMAGGVNEPHAVLGLGLSGNGTSTPGSQRDATTDGMKKAESYSWYGVEVTNRSIADEAKREEVQKHLRWLIAKLENPEFDHQLISLKYEMMAGKNAALADEVRDRALSLEAKALIRDEEL